MNYPGGKGVCYRNIISLMPPHEIYIEPFLGGGSVLLNKKPSTITIAGDADPIVISDFKRSSPDLASSIALLNVCAFKLLRERTWQGGELVYCDPPYIRSTRSKRRIYRYELEDGQHRDLVALLVTLPCYVMLSGYQNLIYDALQYQHGWRCQYFTAGTRGGQRTERVWYNFSPAQTGLHDARYVGSSYRDRERIRRKVRRWCKNLDRLPHYERQAILQAFIVRYDDADVIVRYGDVVPGELNASLGKPSISASRVVSDEAIS